MKKILLVGEPMILFIANKEGDLSEINDYSAAVCGAELNVAIGLARLGYDVEYVTKLGKDEYGKTILQFIKDNNIGTKYITFADNYKTGYMKKSKVSSGDPKIEYHRAGSAASTLSINDLINIDLKQFDLIHITGISPALSESCKDAIEYIVRKANKDGVMVSFDPNLRPQLWKSVDIMKKEINFLASNVYIFLPGKKEGSTLCNKESIDNILDYYLNNGAKCVIVKDGANGSVYATRQDKGFVKGFKVEKIVDTVGAGDGFAVGALSALLEGLSFKEALKRGNAIGALQIQVKGDNEGLPTRKQLDKYLEEQTL